jgi:hypothetical protein
LAQGIGKFDTVKTLILGGALVQRQRVSRVGILVEFDAIIGRHLNTLLSPGDSGLGQSSAFDFKRGILALFDANVFQWLLNFGRI